MMIAEKCWPCIVGLHEECYAPELTPHEDINGPWLTCCCTSNPAAEGSESIWASEVGRPVKEPSDIESPEAIKNTGRKRAQMLYPIYPDMECEWAWLKFAGGGPKPIIGCAGNIIQPVKEGHEAGHRHHGPNKNTIANEPGNVHRICATCHVRWHTLNNEFYAKDRPPADRPYLPIDIELSTRHDPDTRATDEEREEWEAWWSKRKPERLLDIED